MTQIEIDKIKNAIDDIFKDRNISNVLIDWGIKLDYISCIKDTNVEISFAIRDVLPIKDK